MDYLLTKHSFWTTPEPTGGCLHPQFFRPSAGTESCILAHFERSNFWLYNTFRSGPCHSDLSIWNLILKQSRSKKRNGDLFLKIRIYQNTEYVHFMNVGTRSGLNMFCSYNFRIDFFISDHCESKGVRLAGKIESNKIFLINNHRPIWQFGLVIVSCQQEGCLHVQTKSCISLLFEKKPSNMIMRFTSLFNNFLSFIWPYNFRMKLSISDHCAHEASL